MIQKLHQGKSLELQQTSKLPVKFIFSDRDQSYQKPSSISP